MPSQRTLSSRWHDVFSARVKLACPESVASSNTVQTSGRLRLRARKTKRAMQGESFVRAQRVCAVRGGLPPGFRCNCEGFLGFPRGFLRVPDRRLKWCQKTAVWVCLRRLCHAAKTKKEYKGIWSLYESSPKIFQRHQWSSGRIHRCHRCDPGSVSG